MKYTYWQYKNKEVSGLDYVKDHYIGESGGEVMPIEIYEGRFIYAIKRTLKDYNNEEYDEYKVYDLDNPLGACVDKYVIDLPSRRRKTSLSSYWNRLKGTLEMRSYLDARIEFQD